MYRWIIDRLEIYITYIDGSKNIDRLRDRFTIYRRIIDRLEIDLTFVDGSLNIDRLEIDMKFKIDLTFIG